MKYFALALVALVAVVSATTPAELKEKIVQIRAKCIKDTGVSEDLVTKAREGTLENDPKLKEYLACFLKTVGGLKEDGEFDTTVLKALISSKTTEENVNKIVTECAVKKDTLPETAFEYTKCSLKHFPQGVDISKN